ncbi:MAG: heme-dependent oxidative N-demethylase subunit alpha family protein [Verrucomicrobiota bacterium]|nr:heme-dependent oxidative N-demethylase subunit alpha family protein [Verrucomicrobiota bacterium]
MKDLFYSGPFEFRMGLERAEPRAFFCAWPGDDALLVKRRECLAEYPDRHSVLLPKGELLLTEFHNMLSGWGIHGEISALGQAIAPDWLLLKPDNTGMPVLLGGCVCFPSSWAFEEKIGRPLDCIHSVVPSLNERLGEKTRNFLTKMPPGQAWLRANWGLTASPELNQHPALDLPKLTIAVELEEVWFRIERQALVALPETGGILFGIRLEVVPLAKLMENHSARDGLLEALKTMSEKIADYKNLTLARSRLIELLA